MGFNPDNYEPVATRLDRWLTANTDTRVITHCVEYHPDRVLFRAELYLSDVCIATGWAEEQRTDRGITAGSMVEVAETSAIGRALANAGLAGSDPARRASREEMQKADRWTERPQSSGPSKATDPQLAAIRKMAAAKGIAIGEETLANLTKFEASKMIDELKGGENVR